jgi:hypothetical protein
MLCLECLTIFEGKLDFDYFDLREVEQKQGIDVAALALQGCYLCFCVWEDFLKTEAGKKFNETATTDYPRFNAAYFLTSNYSSSAPRRLALEVTNHQQNGNSVGNVADHTITTTEFNLLELNGNYMTCVIDIHSR